VFVILLINEYDNLLLKSALVLYACCYNSVLTGSPLVTGYTMTQGHSLQRWHRYIVRAPVEQWMK